MTKHHEEMARLQKTVNLVTIQSWLPVNDLMYQRLERGALVMARYTIDGNVGAGTIGVVFEPFDHYKDGCGPMVRWTSGACCNVYDDQVLVYPSSSGFEVPNGAQ